MAYDVHLANRLRESLADEAGLSEKAMFGGLGFMINGNLAVSASSQGGLLLRIDRAETRLLIAAPHVSQFEMRGRPLDGWLRIDAEALESDADFKTWVGRGVTYARSLPPK